MLASFWSCLLCTNKASNSSRKAQNFQSEGKMSQRWCVRHWATTTYWELMNFQKSKFFFNNAESTEYEESNRGSYLTQRFCFLYPHGTRSFPLKDPVHIKCMALFFGRFARYSHFRLFSFFPFLLATRQQRALSFVHNYIVGFKKHCIFV